MTCRSPVSSSRRDLAKWLTAQGMGHVRGAPCHPHTHGKIERWHQTLKNRIGRLSLSRPTTNRGGRPYLRTDIADAPAALRKDGQSKLNLQSVGHWISGSAGGGKTGLRCARLCPRTTTFPSSPDAGKVG
jgi:transposase InsO family protein